MTACARKREMKRRDRGRKKGRRGPLRRGREGEKRKALLPVERDLQISRRRATVGHRVRSEPAARFQPMFALRIQQRPHRQTNLRYAGPWVPFVKWSHPPSAPSVRQEVRSRQVGAAFQRCYPSSTAAAAALPNGKPSFVVPRKWGMRVTCLARHPGEERHLRARF